MNPTRKTWPRPGRFRPRLDPLEGRDVPSAAVVDDGDPGYAEASAPPAGTLADITNLPDYEVAPHAVADPAGDLHLVYQGGPSGSWHARYAFKPAGGAWQPAVDLGGSNVAKPRIARAPDGGLHVVWVDGNEVWYRARTPAGAWGATQRVSPADGRRSLEAAIAADGLGRVHVVWHDDVAADNWEVHYRKLEGGVWSPTEVVSVRADDDVFPRVAAGADGRAYVVWHNPVTNQTYFRERAAGGGWSGVVRLDTSAERSFNPDVAVDAADRVHVAWHDNRGGDWDIAYARRAAGGWSAPQYFARPGATDQSANLAVGPDGAVVVAWTDYNGAFYARDAGAGFSAPRQVIHSLGAKDNTAAIDPATNTLHFVAQTKKAGVTNAGSWDLHEYRERFLAPWAGAAGAGYGGDVRRASTGTGANTATWTFTGLAAGTYAVQATWAPAPAGGATNAPYRLYDGATLLRTVAVDQRAAPAGAAVGGRPFQSLGTVTVTGGTLRVVLSDAADGAVTADAVRIELQGPANTPPTTSGLPAVTAAEDGPDTAVNLLAAFADAQDPPAALTYAVVGNTNPGLFRGVTVGGGTLTLAYAPNASGAATLTVRATDAGGLSVSTSFAVTVGAVADRPAVSAAAATGNAGTAIPLTIGAALADTDGSETLALLITGVPTGAALNRGTATGNGTWAVAPADLPGLTILVPDEQTFTLSVTATAREASNGSTASAGTSLTVTATPPVIPTSNLTNAAGDEVYPHAVTDAAGGLHLVYQGGPAAASRVFYRYRPAGGAWQAAVDLGGAGAQKPRVAVTPDGAPHVVWFEGNEVWYRARAGGSWTAPLRLSAADGRRSLEAAIAADPQGRLHVVWHDEAAGNWQVNYRRFEAGAWGPTEVVSVRADHDVFPRVAAGADGRVHVVWHNLQSNEVYYRGREAAGGWGAVRRLDTTADRSFHADVAAGAGGAVHVVWHDNRGGEWDIAYAALAGGSWTSPVYFGAPGVTDAFAAVTTRPDGRPVVVWMDYDHVYTVAQGASGWLPVRRVMAGVGARDVTAAVDPRTGRTYLLTSGRKAGLTFEGGWDLFWYAE